MNQPRSPRPFQSAPIENAAHSSRELRSGSGTVELDPKRKLERTKGEEAIPETRQAAPASSDMLFPFSRPRARTSAPPQPHESADSRRSESDSRDAGRTTLRATGLAQSSKRPSAPDVTAPEISAPRNTLVAVKQERSSAPGARPPALATHESDSAGVTKAARATVSGESLPPLLTVPSLGGWRERQHTIPSKLMSEEPRQTREAQSSRFLRMAMASKLELRVEREGGTAVSRLIEFDQDLLRIGSHPSNDVVLNDPRVSRFHCRLTCDKRVWRVLDTDSLNGTRLHGVRVQDGFLPGPECVIELGDSVVRIRELSSVGEVEVLDRPNLGDLYGTSVAMRRLFAIIERVAMTDANVLIEGESGTGKELVATEVVRRGPRAQKPFVIVDCSSISPNLIESELFGHAKGAFTGADRERVGAFEAAQGGTVFLDEIGEMPLEMQPKLLRALEAREIRRIGETATRKVDVRVVAATNRKLEREVNHGRFREDLYFRLSVVTVRLPPLRERLDDIELLVRSFLDSMNANHSSHLFTKTVMDEMARYDWPGNVRELKNFVERTIVLQQASHTSNHDELKPAGEAGSRPKMDDGRAVDVAVQFRTAKEKVIADFERHYVAALLEWSEGNISRAARKAGMDRMNLYRLIQRYGLRESRTFKD